MFRQSPRRNGRSGGMKVKHVLQISVLLGVGIWLLYQLQKSPAEVLKFSENVAEPVKLGRKDPNPGVYNQVSVVESPDDENKSGDEEEQEVQGRRDSFESSSKDEEAGGESSDEEFESGGGVREEIPITESESTEVKGNEEENAESKSEGQENKETENENLEISGAKESGDEDKPVVDDTGSSNQNQTEEAMKNEEIKVDEENQEQTNGNVSDESQTEIKEVVSSDAPAGSISDETNDGVKEGNAPLESSAETNGVSDQQDKADDDNSNQAASAPSNETVLKEQSEKTNSTDDNSADETHSPSIEDGSAEPPSETNTEASPGSGISSSAPQEASSPEIGDSTSHDSDTSDSDTIQNSQVDSPASFLQEEKDARTDIETLPESGSSHEEAIAK